MMAVRYQNAHNLEIPLYHLLLLYSTATTGFSHKQPSGGHTGATKLYILNYLYCVHPHCLVSALWYIKYSHVCHFQQIHAHYLQCSGTAVLCAALKAICICTQRSSGLLPSYPPGSISLLRALNKFSVTACSCYI